MERFTNALNTIHHQYGPIVRLRLGIDMVFLFEPEDVAKVFRTEGEYPTRPPFEALKKIRLQDSVNYRCAGMFSE